ncbi:hypothetical protein S83_060807 [Arachis hypogaea]
MPYEFTLSELHPAEGQFPFSHVLILVRPHYDVPYLEFPYVYEDDRDLTQHFSIPALQVEPILDNPWGHHVVAAHAAPFDLVVADPSDDSPTWVEQLEANLESDKESIPEEVGPVIRELFGDHPDV